MDNIDISVLKLIINFIQKNIPLIYIKRKNNNDCYEFDNIYYDYGINYEGLYYRRCCVI